MEPERVAQVQHQAHQVGDAGRAARSDTPLAASGLKVAGATSSPRAATRNSPVLRLLNRMSSVTRPCQLGALVTGRSA